MILFIVRVGSSDKVSMHVAGKVKEKDEGITKHK